MKLKVAEMRNATDQSNDAQRAALYARVSSDLQSAASIDDQLRICAEWPAKEGWLVVESYTDPAISGQA